MNKFKEIISNPVYYITVLLMAFLIFSMIKCNQYKNQELDVKSDTTTVVIEHWDTIIQPRYDTIFREKVTILPGRIDKEFIFVSKDSLVYDTIRITGIALDTIKIDSLAIYFTMHEKIVTHEIFTTNTITNTVIKYPSNFGVCVYAGLGGQYGVIQRKFDFGPQIGIGVYYKLGKKKKK